MGGLPERLLRARVDGALAAADERLPRLPARDLTAVCIGVLVLSAGLGDPGDEGRGGHPRGRAPGDVQPRSPGRAAGDRAADGLRADGRRPRWHPAVPAEALTRPALDSEDAPSSDSPSSCLRAASRVSD